LYVYPNLRLTDDEKKSRQQALFEMMHRFCGGGSHDCNHYFSSLCDTFLRLEKHLNSSLLQLSKMSEAKPSAPSDVRAYMVAYYSIAVVEAIYISVLSGLLDVSKAMDQLIRVCSSMGEMSREATEAIISSPISKSAVDLLAHLLSSSILLLDRSAVVKSLQIDKKEETVEYRGLGAYAWEKVTLRFCLSLY